MNQIPSKPNYSASVWIDRHSAFPGDRIRIHVRPVVPPPRGRLQLDLYFQNVRPQRNALSFSICAQPTEQQGALALDCEVPKGAQIGVTVLMHIYLVHDLDGQQSRTLLTFSPVFFAVQSWAERPTDHHWLQTRINWLEHARADYINRIHSTKSASARPHLARHFCVKIFGIGCLIKGTQQLAGFRIDPLDRGLSHRGMLELVNVALTRDRFEEIPFLDRTELEFQQSTPAFAITYPNLYAVSQEDAFGYCRKHAEGIFQLLAMDRGQLPREFGGYATIYQTTERWHYFHFPGYRGNLLAAFDPGSTSDTIDRLAPKLAENAFARLLLDTYTAATSEDDPDFELLRYWSVLEMVANRRIKGEATVINHPDGTPITTRDGSHVTTKGAAGKVYEYIVRRGAYLCRGGYQVNGQNRQFILGESSRNFD